MPVIILIHVNQLRGYIFQNISFINKNFFIKDMDTFGHIVVCTIYTSHIDHFTPQHKAFEHSAANLTVFLELHPGLIPCAIL